MSWEVIYLVCFIVGLLFAVLSFLGGVGHLHIGHFHIGHAVQGNSSLAYFNGFALMAFLCWFGGAGLLLMHHRYAMPIVLLLSMTCGLVAATVVSGFFVKILLPRERLLLADDTEMRGVIARVSSSIREGGMGEILYSLNGTRRGAAARSESGEAIGRNVQVLVLRYERGVATVRPWTDLDDMETPT